MAAAPNPQFSPTFVNDIKGFRADLFDYIEEKNGVVAVRHVGLLGRFFKRIGQSLHLWKYVPVAAEVAARILAGIEGSALPYSAKIVIAGRFTHQPNLSGSVTTPGQVFQGIFQKLSPAQATLGEVMDPVHTLLGTRELTLEDRQVILAELVRRAGALNLDAVDVATSWNELIYAAEALGRYVPVGGGGRSRAVVISDDDDAGAAPAASASRRAAAASGAAAEAIDGDDDAGAVLYAGARAGRRLRGAAAGVIDFIDLDTFVREVKKQSAPERFARLMALTGDAASLPVAYEINHIKGLLDTPDLRNQAVAQYLRRKADNIIGTAGLDRVIVELGGESSPYLPALKAGIVASLIATADPAAMLERYKALNERPGFFSDEQKNAVLLSYIQKYCSPLWERDVPASTVLSALSRLLREIGAEKELTAALYRQMQAHWDKVVAAAAIEAVAEGPAYNVAYSVLLRGFCASQPEGLETLLDRYREAVTQAIRRSPFGETTKAERQYDWVESIEDLNDGTVIV